MTDASGAAIPDAAMQVKNVGTGLTQTTNSNAQGRYKVPDLGIGDYEVQATKTGFSTAVRKGITLTVGSQSVVDFAMQVGQQTQTVTVEGTSIHGGCYERGGRHADRWHTDGRLAAQRPQFRTVDLYGARCLRS